MKNNSFAVLLSTIILCISTVIGFAQEPKKHQASVRLESGITIFFTSETDPPNSIRGAIGAIEVGSTNNIIHRAFIDDERGVYFGYDIKVEPSTETGQFKLIFQPLSITPHYLKYPKHVAQRSGATGNGSSALLQDSRQIPALKALKLPKYPEPQIVQDGDTVAFDVLVNPKTSIKVIDLMKISTSDTQSLQPTSSVVAKGTGGGNLPAKDFSVEAVQFKITSSRLLVNGHPVTNSAGLGVTGGLVWFYLSKHGRFILSLIPREAYNFQKTGTIQGNKISFSIGENQYEWISSSPIISGQDDNWNLWILHEPDYVPEFAVFGKTDSNFFLAGAAVRLEHLVKKK